MKYCAFLSYSRHDDRQADKLHRKLDGYRLPRGLAGTAGAFGPIPEKLHPIFRDRTDLSGGGSLTTRIETALKESEVLIVLCSPAAAASRYVNSEIDAFVNLGRADRLFPVIAGNLEDTEDVEANFFPPALRDRGLLAADLREIKLPSGKVIGDGHRGGVLKLIAGMLGVALDELILRERQRSRRRLVIAGVSTLAGAGAIAAAGGLVVTSTWRPALNGDDHVEIRQGPKEFGVYNRVGFSPRVELPFFADDLDALNGGLDAVQEEEGGGLWFAMTGGVRRWGIDIAEQFEPKSARAWRARLGLLDQADLRLRGRLGQLYPVRPDASLLDAQIAILAPDRAPPLTLWHEEWRLPQAAKCRAPAPEALADYARLLLSQDARASDRKRESKGFPWG